VLVVGSKDEDKYDCDLKYQGYRPSFTDPTLLHMDTVVASMGETLGIMADIFRWFKYYNFGFT
jgi:hypothetical protein